MKEEYGYLNDEELEALIADVEKSGMIAPPVYLKELIMERAAQEQDTFEEGLPKELIPKTAENTQKAECVLSTESSIRAIEVRKEEARRAKRRFRIYSFKIAAAAAVAVFCLTVVPIDIAGERAPEGNPMEKRIEEDIERYQREKERALADVESGSAGLKSFLDGKLGFGFPEGTDRIWNGLTNWFGMEE